MAIWDPRALKPLTIITGHYGSGKTNLALNIAHDLAKSGASVTLVDMDIVNPYFRTSDYAGVLAERGIKLIAPNFAGSTLDVPSLSAAVDTVFTAGASDYVLIDVGGDDVGATALGRYSAKIAANDYDALYVVNHYRNLTAGGLQAAVIMREIEATSNVSMTAVVNNSHLQDQTTVDTVEQALDYGLYAATSVDLPLMFTTVPHTLLKEVEDVFSLASEEQKRYSELYPVKRYVHTLWEHDPWENDSQNTSL